MTDYYAPSQSLSGNFIYLRSMNTPNQATNEQPGKDFLIIFSIITFIINLLSFLNSYTKGGWAQLALIVVAPIYNGLLILVGSIIVFKMGKKYPNASMSAFWLWTILMPLVLLGISIWLCLAFARGGGC